MPVFSLTTGKMVSFLVRAMGKETNLSVSLSKFADISVVKNNCIVGLNRKITGCHSINFSSEQIIGGVYAIFIELSMKRG